MFVAGMLVGPIVGVVLITVLRRWSSLNAWVIALLVSLLLVFVLFNGFFTLELKLGLGGGMLLGVLLGITRPALTTDEAV